MRKNIKEWSLGNIFRIVKRNDIISVYLTIGHGYLGTAWVGFNSKTGFADKYPISDKQRTYHGRSRYKKKLKYILIDDQYGKNGKDKSIDPALDLPYDGTRFFVGNFICFHCLAASKNTDCLFFQKSPNSIHE